MKRRAALTLLGLLLVGVAASGQARSGSVTVLVRSNAEGPLRGALVTAESRHTLTRRSGLSDERGRVALIGLAPAADYVITARLEGHRGARNDAVQVRAGQDYSLSLVLERHTVTDELTVTSSSPGVDVTSAVAGQAITLDLTESLPTGRSYQDFLQLVPGVMPAVDHGQGSNPASRSGLNYRDLLGEAGQSRDNYYYIEGIDVTDRVEGLTQTDLNTEIIQEQSVLTGGLPAEFVGASGLISHVITKSGGNTFSGSLNYYFQNDSLIEDNEHFDDQAFETFDAAFTLGGPITRDRAWFFASVRKVDRVDDVVGPDGGKLRSIEREEDQGFLKLSWAPTGKDHLTGVFLSDPTKVSGQRDNTLSNARDFSEQRGGSRYGLAYSRVFRAASLDVGYSRHEADLDRLSAVQRSRNDVAFRIGDPFTQADEQQGGAGSNDFRRRGNEGVRGAVELFSNRLWGDHTLKAGIERVEVTDSRDQTLIDGASYLSLAARYLADGVSAGEVSDSFSNFGFTATSPTSYTAFLTAIDGHPRRDEFYALLDRGCSAPCTGAAGDGVISPHELGENLVFSSTTGNPDGQINYVRTLTLRSGARTTVSQGTALYLQDTWQWNRWSANAGVRAEEWRHTADTGEEIFTFDWELAPRLSLAYDVRGHGRQRLALYYGRYYDPIRHNATNFAGALTTREEEAQVYVGALEEWVSFGGSGGTRPLSATFSPHTRTPYTDEWQIGYKQDLGQHSSLEANLVKRESRDLAEDFSYGLYADSALYPGPVDHPDSLFLGPGYFGFSAPPGSNFNIMTLPPGSFRDWEGAELVFRRRYNGHWQMLASYNYADAEGNTNSDSSFDLAGDGLVADPRAPNQRGRQAGLVEHLAKVAGSYDWDSGARLGGTYRWSSGTVLNVSERVFRRHLPARVAPEDAFEFAGITSRWVRAGAVGGLQSPSYGVLDLRLAYLGRLTERLQLDLFVDVFNVLDDQEAVQIQDREAGGDGFAFGEGIRFVDPRRYFIGARLRFE